MRPSAESCSAAWRSVVLHRVSEAAAAVCGACAGAVSMDIVGVELYRMRALEVGTCGGRRMERTRV